MSHKEMSVWVDRDDDDDDEYEKTSALLTQLVGKLPAQYIMDPLSKRKLEPEPVEQSEIPYEYMTLERPQPGNLDETLDLDDNRVPSNLRVVVNSFKDKLTGKKISADNLIYQMLDGIKNNAQTPKQVFEHVNESLQSQLNSCQQQLTVVQNATNLLKFSTPNRLGGEDMEPTEQEGLESLGGPVYGEVHDKTRHKGPHAKTQKPEPAVIDETAIAKYMMKKTVDGLKKQGSLSKVNPAEVCVIPDCNKKATCECTICGKLLYCSSKHLKLHSQAHAASCKKYRLSPDKCVTAARECKTGDTILVDIPAAAFPHNRQNSQDHQFPTNYCTKCCTNFNSATELCSGECKLRVCSNQQQCVPPKYGATSHSESECAAISCHYIRQKWLNLRATDSIIGLARTVLQKPKNEVNLKKLLFRMSSLMKVDQIPNTSTFKAKLELFRKYLDISDKVIGDEDLKRLDAAFTRFGRNTGLDVFIPAQYDFNNKRDIRGFYNEASYMLHSCIPNSAVICDPNSRLYVQAYKPIRKGDPITICYDNRCVFWPIWRRRNYLKSDYDFTCKCPRCTSISDLDTYFSVFPCSRSSCSSYIVPEDPLVSHSNWICKSCGITDISYQRVEHLIMRLEDEIEQVSGSAIALWEKITDLINEKYLHWNHFIVFNTCVKLFNSLWKQLNEQHPSTTQWYYKDEGRAVRAANTLLDLTVKFMPYGYQAEHCLALRVAGVVKMHELAEKVKDESVENSVVEEFVHATYFRSEVFVKKPLYEIIPLNMTHSEHANLQTFEFKALCNVYESLARFYGTYEEWDATTPYLLKFITFMVDKNPTLPAQIKLDQYITNTVL